MFDIQYLMSEWHDKGAILPSGLKHVLKQCMKIVGVSLVGNGIGWLLIDFPSYLLKCNFKFSYSSRIFLFITMDMVFL